MNLMMGEIPAGQRDWRLPENRLEAFRRVAITRMYEGDLDHWHSGLVITKMMDMTPDQRAIYCLLFGHSYRNHWAMIVMQQFPDILATDAVEVQEWLDKNWKRAFFAKDTKWGLRLFPQFIESVKETLAGESPYDWIKRHCTIGTTEENFYSINKALRSIHGIGRMTAWLAQQTIFEFFRYDIDHWDLQLYDDTWSQYDSIAYLYNREDIATRVFDGKDWVKRKPTKGDIKLMEGHFQHLMKFLNEDSPMLHDVYNIESCLCEYRKTCGAAGRKPKEFLFWTTNELCDQYSDLRDAWPEIDWKPYVASFMTKGRYVTQFSLNEEYFTAMNQYGLNLNTHYYFGDECDGHKVLDIQRRLTPGMKQAISDWETMFIESEREELIKDFNPKGFLRVESHGSWIDGC